MRISLEHVKTLREMTGAGVVESKAALVETKGDIDAAVRLLRKKGQATAFKKRSRVTKEGVIGSYVHPNKKIATLVEVGCETDFVARTEAFQELAHELAMQVAATNPAYLRPEDVPETEIANERDLILAAPEVAGKAASVVDKIVSGKLEKYFSEQCLLKQPYIKDDSVTVEQLVADAVTTFGENIQVGRFVRFQL